MGSEGARVDDTPLTTSTEPDAVAGMEYVVPEIVIAEPSATVCPGAMEKAVAPSFTVALTTFCCPLPIVRTGDEAERVEVAPFTTRIEPDAEEGIE